MDLPYGIAALDRPRRLPRAGRIRLGEKDKSKSTGEEFPRELDYFNLIDAPQVADYYARVQGVAPDDLRLRELDIIFPVNDKRTILDLAYMAYGKSGWKCRGDGITAYNRELDEAIDCAGEDCQLVAQGKCKRQGRLTYVCYLVPGLCVYDSISSAWRTLENWLATIETLQDLFGRIDSIPLKLYREPYEMTCTDSDGTLRKRVHHCCRLDVAASLLDVKRLRLGGGRALELEPAGDECADDMYPRSIQQREAPALPAGPILEQPTRTPDPSWGPQGEAAPDPVLTLLAKVDEDLRCDILTGFDIAGVERPQQLELLERYRGAPDKLQAYLSALVESQLQQSAPPPRTNIDQRSARTPAPQRGFGF